MAALLAAGYRTDRQIAERLTITPATAGGHVQRILEKLGLHSRWQIAAWATAHGAPEHRDAGADPVDVPR